MADDTRLSCPECGDKFLPRNMVLHIEKCDGRGRVCRFNHDHAFSSQSNRRSHERACPDADTRRCSDCHEMKTWEMFNRNAAQPSGYNNVCRSCARLRAEKYRGDNTAKIAAAARLYGRRARPHLVYECARPGCTVSWSRIGSGKSPKYCQWHHPNIRFNSDAKRRALLADRDGWSCVGCRRHLTPETATEDHCFPKQLMAVCDPNDELLWLVGLWNLELMCVSCNSSKNDRLWPFQATRAINRLLRELGVLPAGIYRALAMAEIWQPESRRSA